MAESEDEIKARHRKELKTLEGEKRAAIKKTKSTAGKKAKALVSEYVGTLSCFLLLVQIKKISDVIFSYQA
mgnify:CR=1 FL=1